jgi:hypothetical protein
MAAAPELDCQAKRSKEKISLRFAFNNRSDETVLVFAALYKPGPEGVTVEPNRVYTLIDGGQLTLAKMVVPIKPGVQLEIAEAPYGIKLAPGKVLSDEIHVTIPVEFDNPHELVIDEATIKCRSCRFAIGYARWNDVADMTEPVKIGEKEYFRITYRNAIKHQKILTSKDLGLEEVEVHQSP